MTCLLLLSNTRFFYNGIVDLDAVVHQANAIFCEDEKNAGADEDLLYAHLSSPASIAPSSAALIAHAFYDCAPSGRYGTMNYMLRALFSVFNVNPESEWNVDTNLSLLNRA
ncbi:hypothetical protein ACOME3_009780 [Neoechinorhynchus agilis]